MELFTNRLPERPYHTDDCDYGLKIADLERALKSKHIQPNGPTHKHFLVFDVDRAGAMFDWSDRHAPAPNIAVINPENRFGHLIYALETPVRTAPDGLLKPLKYAAAVESSLRNKLGADRGYSGLICKNPVHTHWKAKTWEPNIYTLDDLADYLDLTAKEPANDEAYGLGRNVEIFTALRQWSYRAIRQGWPSFDRWLVACTDRAEGYNSKLKLPLGHNEVKNIALSVAKWTHSRFSCEAFSAIQARRGKRGGAVVKPSSERQREPWKALGVSRRKYYMMKKSGNLPLIKK